MLIGIALGCSSATDQSGNSTGNRSQTSDEFDGGGSGSAKEKKKEKKQGKEKEKEKEKGSGEKVNSGVQAENASAANEGEEPPSADDANKETPGGSGGDPSPEVNPGAEKNGQSSPDFVGFVTGSRKEGTVFGYALSKTDPNTVAQVSAYLGSPRNAGGMKIGEAVANQSGFAGGFEGNHAFRFTVPAENYESGQTIRVHLYEVGGSELQNSPVMVTAWRPKAAALFEQNKASFSGCVGCHSETNYSDWFDKLVSPPPGQGGSATGNILYRRASGSGHPGGNFCGGGGICNFLSQWWTAEFGG
jgi:hypothetical protein